jgi:hypothetical protein
LESTAHKKESVALFGISCVKWFHISEESVVFIGISCAQEKDQLHFLESVALNGTIYQRNQLYLLESVAHKKESVALFRISCVKWNHISEESVAHKKESVALFGISCVKWNQSYIRGFSCIYWNKLRIKKNQLHCLELVASNGIIYQRNQLYLLESVAQESVA